MSAKHESLPRTSAPQDGPEALKTSVAASTAKPKTALKSQVRMSIKWNHNATRR